MADRMFNELDYTYDQIGLSLVIDPATGIQQFAFHEDSIVVDIARAAGGSGKYEEVKVAYAIFYGPECTYNEAAPLLPTFDQNPQVAELVGTLIVLKTLPTIHNLPKINTIIIKTSDTPRNNGFHDHITGTIWSWAAKEYLNSKKKPVGFGELYKEVHEKLLELNKQQIAVKFWKVDKENNAKVEDMARRALKA
ncbi:uncharacterized protein LY89DRAFT_763570 [Mollisia scopiformis]|uniref:RNase H type-1 domain-containing protein n=1 Tax=Mollisia scopiformis TaxID=149040 RepID=A0A132B9E9_MOLSC|nr:uncharacterized protein LY89DRAFT_763570 [Mollisia scopiformis]KUJ09030.1 hypothetical protein LY89DRAFT_763570 [Mollisia scopiformis]